MFSPYYAWSGRGDPLNHCAVNVALYGRSGQKWAMTERGRTAVTRDRDTLSIGPSRLAWDGEGLVITFDETTAPGRSPLRGVIRLRPTAVNGRAFTLDEGGRHIWRPIAPRAEVEVSLTEPAGSWRGDGYFDTNAGDEPMENAFRGWDWSRAHLPEDTLLFYDVEARSGAPSHLGLRFARDGRMETIAAPVRARLASTGWGIPRRPRGDDADGPILRRTLEDTPFYSRSSLAGHYGGQPAEIIHDSLSLDRLRSPLVRAMLPFRMPRALW